MSNNPPERPDDDDAQQPDLSELLRSILGGDSGNDQLASALEQMGVQDMNPQMMQMLQSQLQAMMSGPVDGAVNLELATDVARKTVSAAGDASVGAAATRDVEQVVQVANLWLDEVTDFPAIGPAKALSRAEWVDQTMPMWRQLVEPVAAGVNGAIEKAMGEQLRRLDPGDAEQLGLPAGINPAALMGQMQPMMARMSAGMFGAQVGQAVGALAGDLVSGSEVGLPLTDGVAMLPANVSEFADGLEVDAGEVNLYLAVREAARARLFAAVPWLGPALIAAVQSYAGDISIDTDGIERAVADADPSDPAAMQEALQGSLFSAEPSEAQQRALAHLETLLALVEGWVDVVTNEAAGKHLPHTTQLSEAVRRRRATGGPAERVFASLVGLELRPRRLRDAAQVFTQLEDALGQQSRDDAWKHPDFAPTADDLDDPQGYVRRRQSPDTESAAPDEVDAALEALLAQGTAELDAEREGKDTKDDGSGGAQGDE
ncbi:zinc-dependent metalloprotease [Flexivirga oryzae]|uniref:Putative hydrolase n=1 Tax=Flexivirga oryzae TaxID=1794944 RepID=A0A839MX28_9MICO|nr:zinc-dependent metalloprotease [Flexivirga oryzae]MBB2890020.1 putative hydrolase [Flexivirga oryzae]MBB2894512.1 putative hydrolase [Flexivirga oryzae]